jgi:hypothetical protein
MRGAPTGCSREPDIRREREVRIGRSAVDARHHQLSPRHDAGTCIGTAVRIRAVPAEASGDRPS